MSAPYTGDLNAAIVAAVHTAQIHADEVDFRVITRDSDGRPTLFRVIVWHGIRRWRAEATTPSAAMADAMQQLRFARQAAA